MLLSGKIQLKITSLYQQRALMWSSHQVRSSPYCLGTFFTFFSVIWVDTCQSLEKRHRVHWLLFCWVHETKNKDSLITRLMMLKCFFSPKSSGEWMVLDTNTPPLNKLTVSGVLEIPDTPLDTPNRRRRSTTVYNKVELDAHYISIQVSLALWNKHLM